jgi:alanine racemase
MRFISSISHINEVQKGEGVSYNYTFTAPKAMRIGVIPAGYYEGVSRDLSNRGFVKISGRLQPITGKICMNHTMISLENVAAKVGDPVVVYSNDKRDPNSLDKLFTENQLSPYELLTNLSPTIHRTLV